MLDVIKSLKYYKNCRNFYSLSNQNKSVLFLCIRLKRDILSKNLCHKVVEIATKLFKNYFVVF